MEKTLIDKINYLLNTPNVSRAREEFYETTRELIREEILEEWRGFVERAVNLCTEDDAQRSRECWVDTSIRAAISAAEILHTGASAQQAVNAIHEYRLEGHVASVAAQITAYISSRGDEFRNQWTKFN
jgi:hypothetical protein